MLPQDIFIFIIFLTEVSFTYITAGTELLGPCQVEISIIILVGFGRACAPMRCAHPSFWALCHAQRGAARPSAYRSFAAPPKQKKTISRNKMSPSRPKLGPPVLVVLKNMKKFNFLKSRLKSRLNKQ
jgi:hypothetical protein